MTLRDVELGSVAEVVRGVTFKPADVIHDDSSDTVECMRTANVQGELDMTDVWRIPRRLVKRSEQLMRAGDVLISSANSWNLVGKCCWVPELAAPTTFGGFVTVLRVDTDKVDPRYSYRWFSAPRTQLAIRSLARQTTNIANLDLNRLLRLRLPLPPLDEQRRIARILDAAESLRLKRQRAIEHVRALADSLFPSADDTVERVQLADVVERIDSGRSPVCESRPVTEGEWGVLKLGAISFGEYRPTENKAMRATAPVDERLEVRAGDVLVTRKNTIDLVGSSVYVRETPPRLLLPDLIFRLVLRPDAGMTATYLQAALARTRTRRAIARLASGSAGSMPNISKQRLLTVEIDRPPHRIQVEFENRMEHVGQLGHRQKTHLAALDALFASLQNRAFSGQL